MSLDFNITKIPAAVKHDADGNMSLVTRCIIFACMDVGIGEITEANAGLFYARLRIVEKLYGAKRGNDKGDIFFTPQEVRDHIGLTTNVFPQESDAKWRTRIMAYALGEAARYYKLKLEMDATDTEQKAG